MVFDIDEKQAEVITLQASADESELLLVTKEDQSYMLTVIDTQTVTQRQKLELFSVSESRGFRTIFTYDDYIVPFTNDFQFSVIAETSAGVYETQFTSELGEAHYLGYAPSSGPVMDFDGRRLIISNIQYDELNYGKTSCSFYLAVFDKTGLTYLGKYNHSLDKSPVSDYSYRCRPMEKDPLTVAWGR